jgi:hypothetical protein
MRIFLLDTRMLARVNMRGLLVKVWGKSNAPAHLRGRLVMLVS